MLGLFCWCAVVSAAVRPALSGVGCLWCFPGRARRAGPPSACGAPPLCPGWVGRAGLPSACGAPPRVCVSRVSSPCWLWALAHSCVCGSWPCAGVCRRLLLCPPPPHPSPPFRLLSSAPPFASWCPAPAGGCAPPLPPPGRVFWVLAPAARFHLSSCFCLDFSVPLALAPVWLGFFFPPRLALVPSPPPPPAVAPGGLRCLASCSVVLRLGVGCCVRRAAFCRAVLCFCAGALLWGALVCCAVGRLPLALATPFLLVSLGAPLRRAVLCGVSWCVVPSCVVMCCGVFLVAVWCRGCSLSAFSVLCTCGFAPPGAAPPPPPVLCVVPSAGLCCRGVLACSALCGAVLLLAVL